MNQKQKLGYMVLGAGIMAIGIIIGQVITPDIEAQNNGVFDKITYRELEVVDKDGNRGIFLSASQLVPLPNGEVHLINQVEVYSPQSKRMRPVGVRLIAVPHRQGMKGKKEFHCKDLMSPHLKRQILKWGKA